MDSHIHVSDEVMDSVVSIAATSVNGVKQIVNNKNLVVSNGKKMKANLSVILNTSENIEKICMKIQERVKEALEGMIDADVVDVTVRVDNIVEG